ncbi:MAG TPA: BBE domain-containing protein [Enteractinococcus sp.]
MNTNINAPRDDTIAGEFFETYTRALLDRDAAAIAAHYAVPSLIEFPDQRIVVFEAAQTENFFRTAFEQYEGITRADADIDVVENLDTACGQQSVYGTWQDPTDDDRVIAFVRESHAMMQPFAAQGEYVNFLAAAELDRAAETTRRAYGDKKYERLVALKDQYDPHNLFRLNHNVAPSAS